MFKVCQTVWFSFIYQLKVIGLFDPSSSPKYKITFYDLFMFKKKYLLFWQTKQFKSAQIKQFTNESHGTLVPKDAPVTPIFVKKNIGSSPIKTLLEQSILSM